MLYTENLQKFYSEKRIWQGIPAIEKTKNGILKLIENNIV